MVGLNHRPASIDAQVANVDAFRREGGHDLRQMLDFVRLIEGDVVPQSNSIGEVRIIKRKQQ